MIKKRLIDYAEARELFDKEFKQTMQLIEDGETHLDNLAEGFTEADRVLFKLICLKPMTNADYIRSMTDEELAKWFLSFGTICEICSDVEIFCDDGTIACGRCAIGIENWLKQPKEEK